MIILDISEINWPSVVAVTIVSFPLGSVWHSKLFGKAWKEDAKPVIDKSNKSAMGLLFGFSAFFHFLLVAGLDLVIGSDSTALSGFIIALFISIFWVFTTMAVTHLFATRSWRLIFIDSGFYIVFFSIAGCILGAW